MINDKFLFVKRELDGVVCVRNALFCCSKRTSPAGRCNKALIDKEVEVWIERL